MPTLLHAKEYGIDLPHNFHERYPDLTVLTAHTAEEAKKVIETTLLTA